LVILERAWIDAHRPGFLVRESLLLDLMRPKRLACLFSAFDSAHDLFAINFVERIHAKQRLGLIDRRSVNVSLHETLRFWTVLFGRAVLDLFLDGRELLASFGCITLVLEITACKVAEFDVGLSLLVPSSVVCSLVGKGQR